MYTASLEIKTKKIDIEAPKNIYLSPKSILYIRKLLPKIIQQMQQKPKEIKLEEASGI